MSGNGSLDAVVAGAGHNGLVCANHLARAGLKVIVLEARSMIGAACTSEEMVAGDIFSSCCSLHMMLPQEVVAPLR